MANPATPGSVDSTILSVGLSILANYCFYQSTQVIFRCVEEVEQNKEGKKSCKLSNLRPVFVGGVVRVGGR